MDQDLINQGNTLAARGNLTEAMKLFEKALNITPRSYPALVSLGKIWRLKEQPEQAIVYFQKAIEINPQGIEAQVGLFCEQKKQCIWQDFKKTNEKLTNLVKSALDKGEAPGELPYENITRIADPSFNLSLVKWWNEVYLAKRISKLRQVLDFNFSKKKNDKIRLGYFSADFRDHPVARLIVDLFKLHDRNKFEVYVLSCGPKNQGQIRKRVENECDVFIELTGLGVEQMARAIYEHKIDILIDLMGFSGDAKPEVIALRPAPIIVGYLGYPGTCGGLHDYMITDHVLTPINEKNYYSEKLIYMPHCYQMLSQIRPARATTRQKVGLPKNATILASFNKPYKIEPDVFATWMKILIRVPNAILWTYINSPVTKKNLLREAKKWGISKKRFIFASKVDYPTYLSRLKLADLALDTHIYNGGATTSDALRMGVPIVTVKGSHYLSRMSESLLRAVGLPHLVAKDLNEYETLAVGLALSPQKLRLVKERLKNGNGLRLLLNTDLFVTKLEEEYLRIYNG